jgi:Acetyltransferase (GNAT) family
MTSGPSVDRASGTELTVMTEAGFAAMRVEEGARVVERNGRFWGETFRGFYQPIHQIATFRTSEIGRPTPRCWGYRAALAPEDVQAANGSIPVSLMDDVRGFNEGMLDRNRARDLRRCRREVEIRRIFDPDIFILDGYPVYVSARIRVTSEGAHVASGGTMNESEYRTAMAKRAPDPRRLLVAGFVDGKLAGYLESYAVAGVLYGRDLFVATEHMGTGIGTGLYLETIQFGVRTRAVNQICLGPVLLSRPGITAFKRTLGFSTVAVPARIAIPAPIGAFIKWRRPAVHYRLTGQSPMVTAAPSDSERE